jgi:DNA-binding transcriptional LysR family regulator
MQHLDNVLVFVKVAEYESISKAARALDMPVSSVSRKLASLESDLGVALMRRTTRRVTLTSQGREYYYQCREPLKKLQDAEHALTRTQSKLEGTLAISVPMILSHRSFMDFLSQFAKDHSGIRVDLYITNAYLNLVAENIDVAIRFGQMQDSSVVAVKIGKSIRHVVASPAYLKGRKLPTEPEELKAHECVIFNARNGYADWDLVSGRRRQRVHVRGAISSRDCQSVAAFVLRGHGVGLMETAYADEAVARGDLVRLLPRWTSTEVPVFAVYPTRKFLPPRVRTRVKIT